MRRRCPTTLIGITLALAAILLGAPAHATERRVGHLELDPHHTVVAFHVGGRIHDVHGTFALRTGALAVDRTTGAADGDIVIDAASGESGNASRDGRMARAVLETDRFPEVRFRAQRLDGTERPDGSFTGTLHGVLNLHGDDHELGVPIDGLLTRDDRLNAHARFAIPYVAWGLTDPSVLLLTVDQTVELDVTTSGHVTWTNEEEHHP